MNEMKAMTTLVGRGSRITERVRRVNRVLHPRMFWAGRRAEPRSVARHSNSRCRCRIELAPRWARLGNRKGLTNSLPMRCESPSRNRVLHSGASPHQSGSQANLLSAVCYLPLPRSRPPRPPNMNSNDLTFQATRAFEFAETQLRKLVTNHPGYFPLFTKAGKWRHESESWTNWCEGFLGGMLWILARRTGETWWRTKAEEYSRLIEDRKFDRTVHDLGFLFLPTWKVWYEQTGDKNIRSTVLTAGQTLAGRFQEKGGYLCSFVAPESLFIDIMMNVEIIFYAAQELGDQRLKEIALKHCLTTRRFLVRGDGSTAHEGIFDLNSGAFLCQSTHQGWRGDSSWARGQAWAMGGFTSGI